MNAVRALKHLRKTINSPAQMNVVAKRFTVMIVSPVVRICSRKPISPIISS